MSDIARAQPARMTRARRILACLLAVPATIALLAGLFIVVTVYRHSPEGPPPNDAGAMVFVSAIAVIVTGLVVLVLAYVVWPRTAAPLSDERG